MKLMQRAGREPSSKTHSRTGAAEFGDPLGHHTRSFDPPSLQTYELKTVLSEVRAKDVFKIFSVTTHCRVS